MPATHADVIALFSAEVFPKLYLLPAASYGHVRLSVYHLQRGLT